MWNDFLARGTFLYVLHRQKGEGNIKNNSRENWSPFFILKVSRTFFFFVLFDKVDGAKTEKKVLRNMKFNFLFRCDRRGK